MLHRHSSVHRHPALLLFLLGCALYAGSLGHGFHFDDFHGIVDNPHIRSPSQVPRFFRDPGAFSANPGSAMYRPLLLTTYAVDHALFDGDAAGYHAVNVLLHATAGVLVWHVVIGFGLGAGVALSTALLFIVHPVHSEAVNYVSSRSELLMAVLLLASLRLYQGYRAGGGGGRLVLAVLVGAGAMLSKSVGVVLPGCLALAEAATGGWRRLRGGVAALAVFAGLSVVYVLMVRALAARALVDAPVRAAAAQLWTQAKAQVYYLLLLAMPVRLNVEHQFAPAPHLAPRVIVAGLLLASLAAVALRLWRRWPWTGFAAGWWALLLLPTTVVPLIVLVNEHRLYLASVGVLLGIALCLRRLPGRPLAARGTVAAWALGAYTIVLAVLALERTRVWDSELSLWADAAVKAPLMLRPHLRLGDALAGAGQTAAAEAAYLRALRLRPAHPAVRNNLGLLYQRQGRWAKAEAQYRALLAVAPDNQPARMNLAELLLQTGRAQEARTEYHAALRLGDTGGRARLRLGQIALQGGEPQVALDELDAAIAHGLAADPDAHIARGVALRALGRTAAARDAYRRALQLAPDRSDAWYNLGNLLVDDGEPEAASAAFRRVVDIDDDPDLVRTARARLRELAPNKSPNP